MNSENAVAKERRTKVCSSKHRQAKVALGMRVLRFPLHLPPESLTYPKTASLSMALVMHQSIPPAPSRNPGLLRCFWPPCQSQVGAFANFALLGGRAFVNPGSFPELLTRTRFPISQVVLMSQVTRDTQSGP